MKKTRTRIGSILLTVAMLLTLLPVGALAADGTVIEIDSNEDLIAAIKGQADGQTWVFTKEGTYDAKTPDSDNNGGGYQLPEGVEMPYPDGQMANHPGPYAFPIYAENLTIKKGENVTGEVVITSTAVPTRDNGAVLGGGNWNWQSFMIISGSNVTIEGVTLLGNKNAFNAEGRNGLYGQQCDKIIETVDGASDLTLRNVKIAPMTVEGETGDYEKYNGTQRSGSIYFSHNYDENKTVTLENVYTYGGIKSVNNVNIKIDGVTVDAAKNTYAYYDSASASYAWNPGIRGNGTAESLSHVTMADGGFTIKADDSIDLRQIFNDSLLDGTIVELAEGNYTVDNALSINHSVSIVGAGADKTVLQAAIEPTTLIQVAGGNVDFSVSGIYVKGLETNTHNNSSALSIGSNDAPSSGKISITDCKFTDFTKNSLTVKGGTATISGNEIVCKGHPGAAGNGIQVDMGAEATVTDNKIKGYESQSDEWSATGILTLRNGKISTLSGNALENCQVALSVSTLYDANDTASIPSDISGNTITNCGTTVSYELDGEGDLAEILADAKPGTHISLYGDYTLDSAAMVENGVFLNVASASGYGAGSLTVAEGGSLTVAEGGTLYVDENTTLTGDVTNNGIVDNYGTISGTVENHGTLINSGTITEVTGDSAIDRVLVKNEAELKAAVADEDNAGKIITLGNDITLSDTLNIGKNVTIDGNGYTISTTAITTQIPAANGESTPYSAIIAATNGADVVLKNLTVKGNPALASGDANLTHSTRYIGVAAIDANLTMENCQVLDITYEGHLQGMQNGFGVYAVSKSEQTVTLRDTTIANFNKTAVIARDQIKLVMDGCTITGFGPQAALAQNGIQFAGDAVIRNTKISGLIYNADNQWKNGSTAIYGLTENGTVKLENVICEDVDTSYYATGGTTTISGGVYVHEGENNVCVSGEEDASITITGGKFDSDIGDYLAPGYAVDEDGNVYMTASSTSYAITVDKADNGTVTSSRIRANKGLTVTLTVKPDEGYKLDDLTVTDKDGNEVKLTDKGDGKYTFTMPASAVTVEASFTKDDGSVSTGLPFTDVKADDWFFEAVKYVYDNKLMDGTSATTFAPLMTTNRAMIVTILWRLEGQPESDATLSFTDVESGVWYTDAVNWAASKGIVKGYSDTVFAPNDTVTREQLATILYRYAESKGYDVTAKGDLTTFADGTNTSSWAAEAMEWAVGSGLLSGKDGGKLDPTGTATRVEVATILMRFVEAQ